MIGRTRAKGFTLKRQTAFGFAIVLLAVGLWGCGPSGLGTNRAQAQSGGLGGLGNLQRADGLGDSLDDSAGDLAVHASILPPNGDRPAQLVIAVDIPPGWHTYSITQPEHGPNRTQIKLDRSDEYRAGKFTADPPPRSHIDDAFPGIPQEEHTGHVTWTAPLTFRQGVDLSQFKISGSVYAQRCSTGCLQPKDFNFTAVVVGAPKIVTTGPMASRPGATGRQPPIPATSRPAAEPVWTAGRYQAVGSDAIVQGSIEPAVVAPGSTIRVSLVVSPGRGAHVYALAARDAAAVGSGKPTLIAVQKLPHWIVDSARPDREPLEETTEAGRQSVYDKPVRWNVNIAVPQNASGTFPIDGIIGYQTCTATSCDFPKAARFKGQIMVGAAGLAQVDAAPLSFSPATYTEAAELAAGTLGLATARNAAHPAPEIAASSVLFGQLHPRIKGTEPTNVVSVIFLGFIGGLILNLMPCVLPVIGLKILAFVEQGGRNRARALVLNIWYSLGLLTVFMVLAVLAANLQWAWGQQFQSTTFDIVMCGIVFTMALSFLGVWEIPIPGFVGSGKSAKLAAKEGAAGAFAKGVLTTVLATPCSGPYLGAVFSYTLTQSPLLTYLVFASIGLGMASPYLLLGAYPSLLRFLPKPGAWMDTFKQLMGFVLLGTVVYLLSLLDQNLFLPVLTLLFGLWAGCWWIGRTPLTANFGRKMVAWGSGAGVAAAIGVFAFTVLIPRPALLGWQPYSTEGLEKLLAAKKTVMVDFTANWCPNCHLNSARAINTHRVEQIVQANGVVPLLADWSNPSPDIERMLKALHSKSIPVLAIFPADHPNEPFVLRDVVSQSEVLETLQEAGPSQTGLALLDRAPR
ncbi:MAG TPA: cytochrome c biogenesis protein CcdA [Pirellulales bacterium]|nr:cytochrome c biogenesis protein CcdA [Pirellulales bacterium]